MLCWSVQSITTLYHIEGPCRSLYHSIGGFVSERQSAFRYQIGYLRKSIMKKILMMLFFFEGWMAANIDIESFVKGHSGRSITAWCLARVWRCFHNWENAVFHISMDLTKSSGSLGHQKVQDCITPESQPFLNHEGFSECHLFSLWSNELWYLKMLLRHTPTTFFYIHFKVGA